MGDQTTKLTQNMAQLVFIFIQIPLLSSFIVDSILSLFQFLVSNVMSILRETQWEPVAATTNEPIWRHKWPKITLSLG